jgi:TolA-binding protein
MKTTILAFTMALAALAACAQTNLSPASVALLNEAATNGLNDLVVQRGYTAVMGEQQYKAVVQMQKLTLNQLTNAWPEIITQISTNNTSVMQLTDARAAVSKQIARANSLGELLAYRARMDAAKHSPP